MLKKVCFFSNEPLEAIEQEQYSLQDINILKDLGFEVIIANTFSKIPLNCDLYFSWWASGSILTLIKAKFCLKPIIVVAGGNEAMLYKDSVTNVPAGYLASKWYKKIAVYLSLKFSSKIIVVSNFMVNDCMKLGAKSPLVVHNSIDTNKFSLSESPREFVTTIFKSEKNVVRLKRGEEFIRAIPSILEQYPEQKFIVIGKKDDYFLKLQEICEELNILENVNFIGSIKNEHVVDWMQRSIAYVQISDTETFGVAIAEAMSCGTQVVVSNRGAIPEVVGKHGVYVDHNSPASVAKGIIEVLTLSPTDYSLRSKELRTHIVKNFSYYKRRDQIEKIINEIFVRNK